eukprot:scaffold67407_cov41-Phaeocystis_antarctica.AAC.2
MRAIVLSGQCGAWEAEPRSAAELKEAAAHYERAAALCDAPVVKAQHAGHATWCRSRAEAIPSAGAGSSDLSEPGDRRTGVRRYISEAYGHCLASFHTFSGSQLLTPRPNVAKRALADLPLS